MLMELMTRQGEELLESRENPGRSIPVPKCGGIAIST